VLLGIQSVSYVRQLSRATGTILADNYNSLQYAADMLRSLNDIGEDSVSRHALRQSLALQQQNITEISEREMTSELGRHIAALSDPVTEAELQTVRQDCCASWNSTWRPSAPKVRPSRNAPTT